ncbi:helix-turn-helix transcriptional regulator [Ramlibacter sp. H39-3-26]|uniref:helix-turn-helix domain-containing protein n=1 Tax=Comamonadaceae TaxID=80864 RepID=UPI0018CA27DE|nr:MULTISPECIES: helix-turn-helix transcriptional regulator [Comamonadaceae]MDF1483673.1 helix-turn-helix transcriptional regulator [Ramlibacter sp. H39-3-26]QPN32100.1 helix-turn-helix transcriptional regulator [Diaphorobacter sp. JS3051]
MGFESVQVNNVVGRRMRARREELGWSQEKVGVLIGIDESSSRARISRYELGTHEPPVKTARLIADALNVPLAYLYCEDEDIATLLLKLRQLPEVLRGQVVREWQLQLV